MSPGDRSLTAIGILIGAVFAFVIASVLLARSCRGSRVATELVRAVSAGDRARVSKMLGKDRSLVTAVDESGGPVPAAGRLAVLDENDRFSGEARSCQDLGLRYEKGDGVPADRAKASELYRKACDGGQQEACGALKELASRR